MPTRRTIDRVDEDNDNDVSEEEDNTTRRNPRRGASKVATKVSQDDDDDADSNNSEEAEESEAEEEEEESEEADDDDSEESRPKRRSSSRAKKGPIKESKKSNDKQTTKRSSSRSTKFSSSMKEPSGDSIRDLFKGGDSATTKKKSSTKGGGSRGNYKRSGSRNSQNDSDDDDDSDEKDAPSTPTKAKRRGRPPGKKNACPKSPAKRHTTQRRKVKTEVQVESESEVESSDEYDSDDEEHDEGEEQDEMKVQRIIASRSEKRKTWEEIGKKMNTEEIENGSRWEQSDDDDDDAKENHSDTFEERFLVKWNGLSYLHCSWEAEDDLLEQVDGAKAYLTTFFRKSENGLLFSSDERCDGDYFDPAYTQIDRILEVNDEGKPLILDKKDPNYENGTGREFLIKWGNTQYNDATYEYERDLVLNDVDHKEHIVAFEKRSKKPTKAELTKAKKKHETDFKRMFRALSDRANLSEKKKDEAVKEYQESLVSHEFRNGGHLRDYQGEGVSWLMSNHLNGRSSILADEMGLGKTLQTAIYVNTVATTLSMRGPFLIVVPLSTIAHWQREFASWTELNTIVYHGSATDREVIREYEMAYEVDRPKGGVGMNQSYLKKCSSKTKRNEKKQWMVQVVITTPEMLVTDDFAELTAIEWEILVVDEAHRLKNHMSKLASNLRDKRFDFGTKLLLTGTPIQNNMTELWTLMNIIDQDLFDSMDDFLEKYDDIKSKEGIDQLHAEIRPYILRRLKEDVEKSVPPKEETLIEVELTVTQKQYYRALYEKNVQFLHRNKKKALDGPSISNLAMQLRKCCNHPFLLNGVEEEIRNQEEKTNSDFSEGDFLAKASGKLVLLDKLLPRLKENGHRILIFSQFKIMLDIIEDYLNARKYKHERIDGSITGNKRQMAIDRFQAKEVEEKESPFIMLLSTRAGGVGINLTAADTCIIFDSDWNPQNDLQAQARCHRIGQTKSVKVYRLLSRKTYEMQMFHMSSLKMGLDQAVLQGFENGASNNGDGAMTKEEVEKLLRHGAYDIFNEEKTGAAEAESNEFIQQDIDSILARRSRKVIHDNTGSNSGSAGGTFSKASFKAPETPEKGEKKATSEDVDIDDPDFWKKMVGEGDVEDPSMILSGKKRNRKQANYSEKDYAKRIHATLVDSDSDSSTGGSGSVSDDYSSDDDSGDESGDGAKKRQKKERTKWGGSKPSEFTKADAESVLKAIQLHGYGNMPWETFMEKVKFAKKKNCTIEELKRMSWSLALMTLQEAAAEDVVNIKRRAERAAEKKLQAEVEANPPPSPNKGGVLGATPAVTKKDENAEKENPAIQLDTCFKKLLITNNSWAALAAKDAMAFAAVNPPRGKEVLANAVRKDGGKHVLSKEEQGFLSLFVQNIWPALKSRGWKSELVAEGKYAGITMYTFGNRQYRSPDAVLAAVPTIHPELSNAVESTRTAAATVVEAGKDDLQKEVQKASLDPNNLNAASLSLFLEMYSPLQLLVDRKKRHNRIHLSRKTINASSFLHTANALIKRCVDTPLEDFLKNVDKRLGLPHPLWTPRHDAVLIRAVAKHGWIDHDSSCRAITEDSTIKWGAPFDDGSKDDSVAPEATPPEEDAMVKEQKILSLKDTANRAAAFFNAEEEMFKEINGFNKFLVVKAYGLVLQSNDEEGESEASSLWVVDDNLLQATEDGALNRKTEGGEDEASELADLPTKKDLLKRAKAVLAKAVSSLSQKDSAKSGKPTEESSGPGVAKSPPNHNYCVLDQGDRCNILLAEMLRGLMKTAFVKKGKLSTACRKMCSQALQEAKSRRKGIEETNSTTAEAAALSSLNEMDKISEQIDLVSRHIKAASRPAKNVLRVMLGVEPVPGKEAEKDMFPEEGKKQLKIVTVGEKSANGQKRKSGNLDSTSSQSSKKKKDTDGNVTGDHAISRAMGRTTSDLRFGENSADDLELTALETLILSVVLSQGLPVWTENGDAVFTDSQSPANAQGPGCAFAISWFGMGEVVENAASYWHEAAVMKLNAKRQEYEDGFTSKQHKETFAAKEMQTKIAVMEVDEKVKRRALTQSRDYRDNPAKLGKKVVMLLECLRRRMGPVEMKRGGTTKKGKNVNKSENGLGARVLQWLGKDLGRWAQSLNIVDGHGRPFASTAAEYIADQPRFRDDDQNRVSALLDKKACRAVFAQIAQQTRARSIFSKYTESEIIDLVEQAVANSQSSDDLWLDRPPWWKTTDNSYLIEKELLVGLLDYGYSGFDEMLDTIDVFKQLMAEEAISDEDADENKAKRFTKGAAQRRANQLTRELSSLDDTNESIRMLRERGNGGKRVSSHVVSDGSTGVQTGINSFFGASNGNQTKEPIIVVDSDDDADKSDKRKEGDINGTVESGSAEKKVKT